MILELSQIAIEAALHNSIALTGGRFHLFPIQDGDSAAFG
jgi:hypothetical protein